MLREKLEYSYDNTVIVQGTFLYEKYTKYSLRVDWLFSVSFNYAHPGIGHNVSHFNANTSRVKHEIFKYI
jgi:hypothetical protein